MESYISGVTQFVNKLSSLSLVTHGGRQNCQLVHLNTLCVSKIYMAFIHNIMKLVSFYLKRWLVGKWPPYYPSHILLSIVDNGKYWLAPVRFSGMFIPVPRSRNLEF